MMVPLCFLLHFLSYIIRADSNLLYQKYVNEQKVPEDCGEIIPELVLAVANCEFNTKLVKIIFSDLYYADYYFNLRLDKILKGINHNHSAVTFGSSKQNLMAIHHNEQPAWIIFASEPVHLTVRGKILMIAHVSLFKLKEWLLTPIAAKNKDLVAFSDPSLKNFRESVKDCDTGLYTFSNKRNSFGVSKPLILTSWKNHRFTQNNKLYRTKDLSYYGNHMVILVKSKPPFIFERILENRETVWDGLEVRLLDLLKDTMNLTFEFKGASEKEHSSEQLTILEHADLAVGGIVLTESVYATSSPVYPPFIDCAAFISLTSIALPKYRAIMGPFLWDVWIAITFCYIFAIIPMAFSAWHTLRPLIDQPEEIENMFWYVFGTFTNCFTFLGHNSWTKGVKYSTKLFIGTYWVFTIIITACYTGSIIAFITLPIYPEVIDTMHQLLHKNYRVITLAKEGWWELLTGSEDDAASGLAGTAQIVADELEGLSAVVSNAKEDSPISFLGSSQHLKYIVKSNFTNRLMSKQQVFHISKQCFVPQLISMLLPKNSLLVDAFNEAIMKAAEAGLIKKIENDIEWDLYKSLARQTILQDISKLHTRERQLTLDDTQGMFLLLGSGFSIAICSLLFEIGNWIKNREGEKLAVLAKQRLLDVSRKVSVAFFAPTVTHVKEHYPLYFRTVSRRKSSLFGSTISFLSRPGEEKRHEPLTAASDTHLRPVPVEKPIRLLSF